MITTNLLKEIKDKSVQRESHDAEIVKQVQLLLDTKGQEEKKTLELCGLNHHIKVAENITGEAIERKGFFEKYGHSLTEQQVLDLCYKYALRCLNVEYYKGNIGPNVAADINRFVEKHELQAELNSGNLQRCLYIMAPKGAFNLEKRPVDPVLFYCPNRYNKIQNMFIPISKWGNDFTVFRKFMGLFTRPWFIFLFSWSVLSSVMNIIFFSFIPGFVFAGIIAVVITIVFMPDFDDFKDWINFKTYNAFNPFKN